MTIEQIDKNFAKQEVEIKDGKATYRLPYEKFSLFGLQYDRDNKRFTRLPDAVAKATSVNVTALATNTAGGRLRFCTDSGRIASRVSMPKRTPLNHMTLLATTGFDVYRTGAGKATYLGALRPPLEGDTGYETELVLPDSGMRELTLHFPVFGQVSKLEIGLEEGSRLCAAQPYALETPVVFYGSSITQGACVSRPGNTFTNTISRTLNVDHLNLGFAGNAKGEPELARYIAGLSMSLFVLDYDHNAPDPDYLKQTHEPFFLTVRERWPDLPILLTSRTDPPRSEAMAQDRLRRRDVVLATYEQALKRGDRNVRFVDGSTLFEQAGLLGACADSCTVDGTHPNDLGAACIAQAYGREIRAMLAL
jgi:hypothetical protein